MDRCAYQELIEWKTRKNRKPLLIRGARQVGKTHLIREFSKEFDQFVEVNLDQQISFRSFFEKPDPHQIIKLLEVSLNVQVTPGKTLLFFDEIQAEPLAIHCLRYFFEMLSDLHVIAAGSLLEFVLSDHEFSMPVGRIEFLYLGPMTFEEFLLGKNKKNLLMFMTEYSLGDEFNPVFHELLLDELKDYIFVGGMPAVIKQYLDAGLKEAEREKQSILATYKDDFGKYRRRVPNDLLQMVFSKLPSHICEKLKYVNISRENRAKSIADCIHLFELANIIYLVRHSSCSGLPLKSHVNPKSSKILFLDVGLLVHAVGLSYLDFESDNLLATHSGKAVEQFIGQHLLQNSELWKTPELHFWIREKRNSSAELDYVLQYEGKIIPVEVKAGKKGKLLSLKIFLSEKKAPMGIRFNSNLPRLEKIDGKPLISLPIYMVGQLNRILKKSIVE